MVSFSRSSGPGGQNVNKVNTKVDMRFNVANAQDWIPLSTLERLKSLNAPRINKRGDFVVTSDRFRTQSANYEDCLDKMIQALQEANKEPSSSEPSAQKLIRMREHQTREKEARHRSKSRLSSLKASRRRPGRDD